MAVLSVFLLLALVAIGAFVSLVVYVALRPGDRAGLERNWQQIAKRYRAEWRPSGWWNTQPGLRWWYREARVDLRVDARHGHEVTVLTIRHSSLAWEGALRSPAKDNDASARDSAPQRESTWRASRRDGESPLRLLDDLEAVGWSATTLRDDASRSGLTPVAQLQLAGVYQATGAAALELLGGRGILTLVIAAPVHSYDGLHHLLRTASALFDQTQLAAVEGIAFVDDEEVQPLQAVRCNVCGQEITSDLVACRTCKTPHHGECWQYNGQCSTYACGETHYVAPGATKR